MNRKDEGRCLPDECATAQTDDFKGGQDVKKREHKAELMPRLGCRPEELADMKEKKIVR